MSAQRILVSGMGGELGSRIAALLEDEPWAGELVGIDTDPPRRRLRRAVFHRIPPAEHDRITHTVTAFDPHVLVHAAVWEPDARAGTADAVTLTARAATSVLGAAAECRALQTVVVRSGIEVYGRAHDAVPCPDETAPIDPTSTYGEMLTNVESAATTIGERIGVPVARLRVAPVVGSHAASPLGRVLRQPFVPFSVLSHPRFAVLHLEDAARAFVAAAGRHVDEAVNVAAPGSIGTLQAIRRGRRIPVPVVGPGWAIARRLSYLAGAPVPDHVAELFHRGRLADPSHTQELLGTTPTHTTVEAIDELHAWADVTRFPARVQVA